MCHIPAAEGSISCHIPTYKGWLFRFCFISTGFMFKHSLCLFVITGFHSQMRQSKRLRFHFNPSPSVLTVSDSGGHFLYEESHVEPICDGSSAQSEQNNPQHFCEERSGKIFFSFHSLTAVRVRS